MLTETEARLLDARDAYLADVEAQGGSPCCPDCPCWLEDEALCLGCETDRGAP